jgi:hypothetical protein
MLAGMKHRCGNLAGLAVWNSCSDLNRGGSYRPIRNNKIKSCSLREPGAQTGVRLTSRERAEVCGVISNENLAEPSVSTISARFDAPPFCVAVKVHAGKNVRETVGYYFAGDGTRPGIGHHNRVDVPLPRNGRFLSSGNAEVG